MAKGAFKILTSNSKREEKEINSLLKKLYKLCGPEGLLKKLQKREKELKGRLKEILESFGIKDTSMYNQVYAPNEEYMSKLKHVSRKGSLDMVQVALLYPEQFETFKAILEDERCYRQGTSYLSFEFQALKK